MPASSGESGESDGNQLLWWWSRCGLFMKIHDGSVFSNRKVDALSVQTSESFKVFKKQNTMLFLVILNAQLALADGPQEQSWQKAKTNCSKVWQKLDSQQQLGSKTVSVIYALLLNIHTWKQFSPASKTNLLLRYNFLKKKRKERKIEGWSGIGRLRTLNLFD